MDPNLEREAIRQHLILFFQDQEYALEHIIVAGNENDLRKFIIDIIVELDILNNHIEGATLELPGVAARWSNSS